MTTTSSTPASADAMKAAKEPVGTGPAPRVAVLIALALIGIGVVAVQNVLAAQGAISGSSWLTAAVDAADGITGASGAVLAVGIVAAVIGVLLLVVVVKPRPRTGLALDAATGVHLTPAGVARIVRASVADADSITATRVSATRRKVRLRATTVEPKSRAAAVTADLREQVAPVLEPLAKAPRLTISLDHDS